MKNSQGRKTDWLHRKKKSNQKIIGGKKWRERENLKKYVHTRESNLKIPPTSFQPSLFRLGAFAKSNKKIKTTSERDAQLELLGVWSIHQNLKNQTTERCTTWPTWGLSKSNKTSEQHQREIHSLNYLVFVKSTKTSKQHHREMHNLNYLCSPKSNKKLKTCSQRDA